MIIISEFNPKFNSVLTTTMEGSKVILYISKILYPKHNQIWFLIYMYFKYYSVVKRHIKYSVQVLSDSVLWNVIKEHPECNCDINNCVIVHPNNVYPSDKVLLLLHEDKKVARKVVVIADALCSKSKLYISNTFFKNDFLDTSDYGLRLIKTAFNIKFAQELEISLVSIPQDVSNAVVNTVIENYFKLPKIVCKGDIITINIKHFCEEPFYADLKLNSIERLFFKCNKVICNEGPVDLDCFCVIGETSIKQAANIQSFVPVVHKMGSRAVSRGEKSFAEVTVCPLGLKDCINNLNKAIYPFYEQFSGRKIQNLRPVFLIQGQEGCGYNTLIGTLAEENGLHYFPVSNSDLTANIYAQNETKLNNVFFTAKMSAPCIISIHNFENFGKNNEGQYDPRLINAFASSLDNLFDNNNFPVILFCCSNSKEVPGDLRRVFLEVFDIDAPEDVERERILTWLLEKNDIEFKDVDLKSVANQTNGFFLDDLEALVYYSENCYLEKGGNGGDKVALTQEHFEEALDFMQNNYNESLGAPKVPKVQWSDVGGLGDVKEEIIKTINLPLKYPDLFKSSGLTRSGILLFGPPGTGKTLIAKAVATECSMCFLTVKGPELLNMYVGQSEQNVREVFERARQASPCIIFFDELDSLAPNRGMSGDSGGVMDRVVSQLLAEMDGLNDNGKIFIIGATNRPDLIDPALLRPGRFDKLLYVGPCTDVDSKISVLHALTRKFRLSDDVNLKDVVSICPKNITGADFYGICSTAWSSAAKRLIEEIEKDGVNSELFTHEDVVVSIKDFDHAVKNVKPSISEEDLKYFESLRKELSSNVSGKR